MNARRKQGGQANAQRRNTTPVSTARSAAFAILRRVEEEAAYASVLLAAIDEEMRADDRALCYELVMGCLRWQLWLDHLIEHYARRSAASLDAPVRRALRLGLYQLRFLTRIPASAIVNESVNLVYAARVRSAAGFVNAVLRRALREPDFDPATLATEDPLARLSIETSHPLWLIERWADAFGLEETRAFARANNEAPPVAFRLSKSGADEAGALEKLKNAGAVLTPSLIAPDAWRIEGASGALRELAQQGAVYLQDEASQLVAHVLDAQSHERVLDACAAPGSKTTHIAGRATALRLLVAGDVHLHRLQTVREACARLSVKQAALVAYDATAALPFAERVFERVLVDAPCTGTGTLRRNPEIRWRITTADVAELAARQRRILSNAAQMVAPGGRLVYSTCSVEPEENEVVVEAFLREHEEFAPLKSQAPAPLQNEQGTTARTWPQRDGADGFFIAAFERRS
jgi:16S rRNA (cytosine967-C5)-methyltransferase